MNHDELDFITGKRLAPDPVPAVSDEQMFRDFLLIVANIDPLRWNYDEMRALVADARNRLDVAKGGRLSNEAKP